MSGEPCWNRAHHCTGSGWGSRGGHSCPAPVADDGCFLKVPLPESGKAARQLPLAAIQMSAPGLPVSPPPGRIAAARLRFMAAMLEGDRESMKQTPFAPASIVNQSIGGRRPGVSATHRPPGGQGTVIADTGGRRLLSVSNSVPPPAVRHGPATATSGHATTGRTLGRLGGGTPAARELQRTPISSSHCSAAPHPALVSPPGTLLSTLQCLTEVRTGLAQMEAAGLPADAALVSGRAFIHEAPSAPAKTGDSPQTFLQRWARTVTPIDWTQWKTSGSRTSSTFLHARPAEATERIPGGSAMRQPCWRSQMPVTAPATAPSAQTQGATRHSSNTATRTDDGGEVRKALDRIRTVRENWLAGELHGTPSPTLPALPRPAPELLQAMHRKRMATPEPARLEDLIRGRIPKRIPDGHKCYRPHIAERHPNGLFRELQQRTR